MQPLLIRFYTHHSAMLFHVVLLWQAAVTSALVSDACRQEVTQIYYASELNALIPDVSCETNDIVPNFCSIDYKESLAPFKEYCVNTLGMQVYDVDTFRKCTYKDYYYLNGSYCVGKSCQNEAEIRAALTEVYFPLLDNYYASTLNMYCSTTFGVDGSKEQCTAQSEVLYNDATLFNAVVTTSSIQSYSCADGTNCQLDFTPHVANSKVQQICEQANGQYQSLDHVWDCAVISTGSTFQYTFLNDPYCTGKSCTETFSPEYTDTLKGIGYDCKLASFNAASDDCRQEVRLSYYSTELNALYPNITCETNDYVPNFCSFDFKESLAPFKEYCVNTLGMQVYDVDTFYKCQDFDYYYLHDSYCVGKSCQNDSEIQAALTEVYFPLVNSNYALAYNISCNTTFGINGSDEQCTAQSEVLNNDASVVDAVDVTSYIQSNSCAAGKNCQLDFTPYFDYTKAQQACEQAGGQYQTLDHTWECDVISTGSRETRAIVKYRPPVNNAHKSTKSTKSTESSETTRSSESTFQYSFLNDPYCLGKSCAQIQFPADYTETLKNIGYDCKLTKSDKETSSAVGTLVAATWLWIIPVVTLTLQLR